MKLLPCLAVPVLCATLVTVGGGAFAAPVVHDPLVTLKATAAPTALVASAAGGFYIVQSGSALEVMPQFDAKGAQVGSLAVPLPSGAKSSAAVRDHNGVIYTANPGTHNISRFNPADEALTTIGLPAADVPIALAVNASNDIYAVKTNDEVTRISSLVTTTLTFAKLDAGSNPLGIVTDITGNVYTANSGKNTISKITSSGLLTQTFASLSPGSMPAAITIDSKGMLYTANQGNNTVTKFDSSKPMGTAAVAVFTLPTGAAPTALTVDQFDNVFVAETGTNAVGVIIPGDATPDTVLQSASAKPTSLAVSTDNKVLVASKSTSTISSIDLQTRVTTADLGAMAVGSAFNGTAAATGVGDMTFSSRDLPSWLKLDPATGALTGTPTAATTAGSFTLSALSAAGYSDARTVTFTVAAAPVTPTPTPTPTGGAGQTGGTGGTTGGSAGGGSGSGSHGTGSLASTGAGDTVGWGLAGLTGVLLGFAGLAGARLRRRLQDS